MPVIKAEKRMIAALSSDHFQHPTRFQVPNFSRSKHKSRLMNRRKSIDNNLDSLALNLKVHRASLTKARIDLLMKAIQTIAQ